jgi:hypothetical protein
MRALNEGVVYARRSIQAGVGAEPVVGSSLGQIERVWAQEDGSVNFGATNHLRIKSSLAETEEGQSIFACLASDAFERRELGVATSLTVNFLGVINSLYAFVNADTNGLRNVPASFGIERLAIVLTDITGPATAAAAVATCEQDETGQDHRANGKRIWERLHRLHQLHQLLSEIGFRGKPGVVGGCDLV